MPNPSVNAANFSALSSLFVVPMQSIDYINAADSSMSSTYDETLQWSSAESISREASQSFPLIAYDAFGNFSYENMKKISIVVFKAFKDTDNNGKLNF